MSRTNPPVPRGLHWFQPRTTPLVRELRDGDDRVIGTLQHLPRPAITWMFKDPMRARGEVGSSRWELSIERKGISGFFGFAATVFIDAGRTGMLDAGPFLAKGMLALATGRRLQWNGGYFEGPSSFHDETGRLLVRFRSGSSAKQVNSYVDVEPEAAAMPEWPVLAVFGMYLRLLMNRVFDG